MSRAFLIPICALSLVVGAGASDARRVVKAAPGVVRAPVTSSKAKSSAARTVAAPRRAAMTPSSPAKPTLAKANARAARETAPARAIPRIRVKDALSRLPNNERRQMIALIASPRAQGSVPVRRAVAAYLFLRGLKGGGRLPISVADMEQMTSSKRWTSKRMQNLAIVLRTAVGIAQAEGLSANAAFQKALKAHGIQKKFNRGVCGA